MVNFKPIDDLQRLSKYATPKQFGRILRALEEVHNIRQADRSK